MQAEEDRRKESIHFSFQRSSEKLGDFVHQDTVENKVSGDHQYHLMQEWQNECRPLLQRIDELTEKMPKFNKGTKEKEEQKNLKTTIDNLVVIVYHLEANNTGDFPREWLKGTTDHIGKVALDYLGDSTYASLNKKMAGEQLSANEEVLSNQAKDGIKAIILSHFTTTVSDERESTIKVMGSDKFIEDLKQITVRTTKEAELLDFVIKLAQESRGILEGRKALSSFKPSA
jgi:hypothetical protein